MGRRRWVMLVAAAAVVAVSVGCSVLDELDDLDDLDDADVLDDLDDPDDLHLGADDGQDPGEAAGSAQASGGFQPAPCPFELQVAVDVDCGWLTVPESRTGLSDARIEVAVAILRTPATDPAPDPVVFLHGGPGGVALEEHWAWLSDLDDWEDHPILATRDLVLVDQRGTGHSRPALACGDDEDTSDCHDRLVAEGIALAAYSTPQNAADIAELREALGYDEWNLLGSSYGTRLAAAVVRDHPEGVRSIILDGVYPLDVVPAYHGYPANTVAAFTEVFDLCAEQPACTDAYGDLAALFEEAVNRTDETRGVEGYELIDAVFGALYSIEVLVDVPWAIALAADGEVEEALELLDADGGGFASRRRDPVPGADATGKFHAVECREEHAFTDEQVVLAELDRLASQGVFDLFLASLEADVLDAYDLCQDWDVGQADPDELLPLDSTVPALVFSGRFDPITPPTWGRQVADRLPNATFVLLPSVSHSAVLEDACADRLLAGFLDDPTSELDVSCVADATPPRLSVP